MIQQANVSLDEFNETLRRLRETKVTVHGTFVFGQDDGASPVRIIDSTIVSTTDVQPQESTALDAIMEAIQSLPPAPDTTPLRANLWTLDRLREAIPDAKWHGERALCYPGTLFGIVVIEVDEELPDGIIKQGDAVICNVKEQGGE